jgi:phage/plasmid-associated DNA primase
VPFKAFFPAGKADVTLVDRLTSYANLQGLLRAAVGGLQQVMRRGTFALPPSVTDATRKFKMEADPMRGFIEERVVSKHPNDPAFTPRTGIYNSYTTWATINGFHQMSAQRFYESFMAASVDTFTNPIAEVLRDGVKGYKGIELR